MCHLEIFVCVLSIANFNHWFIFVALKARKLMTAHLSPVREENPQRHLSVLRNESVMKAPRQILLDLRVPKSLLRKRRIVSLLRLSLQGKTNESVMKVRRQILLDLSLLRKRRIVSLLRLSLEGKATRNQNLTARVRRNHLKILIPRTQRI